jgi:transposase
MSFTFFYQDGSDPNADYSLTTRTAFIDRMLEQPGGARNAKLIGGNLGVHEKTAQRWWKSYQETGEVPVKKSTRNSGRPCNFTTEHKQHVQKLIDEEPQVTVTEVVDNLVAKFADFSLSKTQVHHHMKTTCNLSVSIPRFEPEKRNSEEKIEERYKWFMDWKDAGVDFTKNCVFIDESGFHTNMRRNFAWSLVGSRPVVKTPVTRAVTHTVLGAITADTVIHVSLRKPAPPAPKPKKAKTNKRKKKDVEAEVVEEEQGDESADQQWPDDDKPAPKGTTSAHYIKFIKEVLDIMDEIGTMKGYYLVMDNCSIHKNKYLQRKTLRRGYNIMYLPSYSPELNPIENFWSLVKGKMKRVFFAVGETMTSRIRAACEDTHPSELYAFADHSKRQIIKCYKKVEF